MNPTEDETRWTGLARYFEGPRLPLLVVLATLFAGLLAWTPFPVGIWHDDGVYALTARALASGAGLTLQGIAGQPPAVHFPPLYPAVLAPLWWVASEVEAFSRAAAALNILFLVSAAGVFALYLRDDLGLSGPAAAAATLVGFLHRELWATAFVPLSEPLFVLLLCLALRAAARLRRGGAGEADRAQGIEESPPGRPGAAELITLGVLLLLLVHARTAGVAFVAGAVVAVLAARGLRAAGAVAVLVGLGMTPWMLWSRAGSARIPEPLQDILGRYEGLLRQGVFADPGGFLAGVPAVLQDLGLAGARIMLPGLGGSPLRLLAVPALALAAVGLWRLVRRHPEVGVGLAAYVAMLVVWPYREPRLVVPVAPLLVLALVMGGKVLLERIPARLTGYGLALGTAWALAATLGAGSRLFVEGANRSQEIRTRQLDGMVAAVLESTPPGAVVGAPELWPAVPLHTGRLGVPSAAFQPGSSEGPVFGTPAQQYAIWQVAGVEYVLTEAAGRIHGAALDGVLAACPDALTVLSRWDGAAVVRLDWDADCRARLEGARPPPAAPPGG